MKKIILLLIVVGVLTLSIFKYYENQLIKEKVAQTKEQIEKNKKNIIVNVFGENDISPMSSYFQAGEDLEITSMDVKILSTQNLDTYRPSDYYTNSKNNEGIKQVGVNNFLQNFETGKIFFLTPIQGFFGVTQDYVLYKEDLEDYFKGNIEKLFKNKTQEYGELVDFNEIYQEYSQKYQNNFEKYYEITLEVNSNFSGSGEITYFPYYDNDFYDGNNGIRGDVFYETFVVDNSFYPYINFAEINSKKAEISTVNSYEKYFDKQNFENKENMKNNYHKITYYNKSFFISGDFQKGKNIIKLKMFQFERKKMGYIK